MKNSLVCLVFVLLFGMVMFAQEQVSDYPGRISSWNGGRRHDFQLNGISCILVEPAEAAPGRPWYWKARFFDAFPYPEIELLKQGWTIAYTDVSELFGAPEAVRRFDQFYRFMISMGYHETPALAGYSRGGLIAINFASRYPERVSSLYLDNAVCDFRSWPGSGKYPQGWQNLLQAYGLTEEEAESTLWNPVSRFEVLADANLPVLALCALKDTVVVPEKNTLALERVFAECGGNLTTHYKPEADHHPHSLENPASIVEFVKKNLSSFNKDTTLKDVNLPWNEDFRCQYSEEHRQLVITIWQWPREEQLVLSGVGGEPQEVWLVGGEEKQALPFVVRPDGWHIFLPAVQPSSGDQKIIVQLREQLEITQPVLRLDTRMPLVLDASNGVLENGIWSWKVYFPLGHSFVLRLSQPASVPLKVSNGSKHEEFLKGQQYALLEADGDGVQAIKLEGVPQNVCPNMEFSDMLAAVVDVPMPESGIVLNPQKQAAKFVLPFALDADFMIVARYACAKDCGITCAIGDEEVALDVRASGNTGRFLFLPWGTIRMTSQANPELRITMQSSNALTLKQLLLVPSGVNDIGDKLVTGEYFDVAGKDVFTLPLLQARLIGSNIRVVKGNKSITHWMNPAEYIIWPFTNVQPGRYVLSANIGTTDTSCLAFNAGGETLLVRIPNLHDYDAFKPFSFGVLEIPRSQDVWLQIYPAPGFNPVNLSELKLERVK